MKLILHDSIILMPEVLLFQIYFFFWYSCCFLNFNFIERRNLLHCDYFVLYNIFSKLKISDSNSNVATEKKVLINLFSHQYVALVLN